MVGLERAQLSDGVGQHQRPVRAGAGNAHSGGALRERPLLGLDPGGVGQFPERLEQ